MKQEATDPDGRTVVAVERYAFTVYVPVTAACAGVRPHSRLRLSGHPNLRGMQLNAGSKTLDVDRPTVTTVGRVSLPPIVGGKYVRGQGIPVIIKDGVWLLFVEKHMIFVAKQLCGALVFGQLRVPLRFIVRCRCSSLCVLGAGGRPTETI